MDLYLRRREMMNFDEYSIGTLKYWLSGADGTVNNKWKTRIPDLQLNISGSPWNEAEKCYQFDANNYVGFYLNQSDFTIGNHWRLVFDMDFKRRNTTTSYSQYFLDLGSVTSASKGLGFELVMNNKLCFGLNWKMQGNDSNPGAYIYPSDDYIPLDDEYHHLYGYYEVVDGGDGYDRFQVCMNGDMFYCDTQIPKVFYGPTWDKQAAYIGRGYATNYHVLAKLYDLKFYTID